MDLAISVISLVGSVVCHQIPERSFYWAAYQLPVCARCTGLYVSGTVGVIAWIAIKTAGGWRPTAINPHIALRVLAMAAVPTALSLATGVLGVWDGSNVTRALLAIPLGGIAGAIVAAVATKDLR
jgi:uncharacterized membrane protein